MIHSYPSIYAIGHAATVDLLKGPVYVEEKVDGSCGGMGTYFDENGQLQLQCRSKGAQLYVDAPQQMFSQFVATAVRLKSELHPGWVYRGEVLAKPKHNVLAYARVPAGNFIIFDINTGLEEYLDYPAKKAEAERLGLECVPLLYEGVIGSAAEFRRFLDTDSVLGGQKIEGVVIKPVGYKLFGADKKAILAKFVSEAFKEIHGGEWRAANPTGKDIIDQIVDRFKTPARWQKAVQHLRERGEIEDSPRDIGKLIKEVPTDTFAECTDEMKAMLWKWASDHIRRGLTSGLPQWYKERLLSSAFEQAAEKMTEPAGVA